MPMQGVISILIALLGLSVLILIHEVGHFTAAKLLKVKVLEFAIFMGPKLLSVKKGETMYSLRLIPMGGFVKLEGEEAESDDDRALSRKPKWVRAVVFFAGSFMNLLLAFVFFLIVSMNTQSGTCELSEIPPGSPAAIAGFQTGDVLLKYGGKTVHSPVDVFLYMMEFRGAESKVVFRRDGNVLERLHKPEYFAKNYYRLGFTGREAYGNDWNLADKVSKDSPAYLAGIEVGDRIVSVSGVAVNSREELRNALALAGGGETTVTIMRADQSFDVRITPEMGDAEENYEFGAGYVYVNASGFFDVVKYAYYNAISSSKMVLYSLKWLVTGRVGIGQMSGPVGIVTVIGDAVEKPDNNSVEKLFVVLSFLALISINLALFNLIPFPALDGSKLLLILVEAIRRKKIPPEREATISFIGFVFLILLMMVTLFNDISRLVTK